MAAAEPQEAALVDAGGIDEEIAGLETLQTAPARPRKRALVRAARVWPPLAAIGIALLLWQGVVLTG